MKTLLLLLPALAFALDRGEELKLWPNGAPGSEGITAHEVFTPSDNPKFPKAFQVVHYPSIYAFLPPAGKANGMAVVIAPGGGHSQLVIDHEGWQIADWLNQHGIAGFVVKYRLARAHAKEWGLDPARVGFIGFSAGGEIAALMETRFDKGNDSSPDPIERQSSRPDFSVIVYPGFKAGEITVPKDAPPAFLVCADNDKGHVVTTVNLYLDLQKQGISSEMHIYAAGGHGFGMRQTNLPVATWPDRLLAWMTDRKFLP